MFEFYLSSEKKAGKIVKFIIKEIMGNILLWVVIEKGLMLLINNPEILGILSILV